MKKKNFKISHERRFLAFFPGQHSGWHICLFLANFSLRSLKSLELWLFTMLWRGKCMSKEIEKKSDFLRFLDCWEAQILEDLEKT